MKAITVRRPWSSAIVELGKDVENRPRNWNYRGPIAIHAGKGWDTHAVGDIARITGSVVVDAPTGVIAVAELVDCHRSHAKMRSFDDVYAAACCESPWAQFDDQRAVWHLVLANVSRLEVPIPCRGALGLWTLPPAVAQLVDVQLAEVAG